MRLRLPLYRWVRKDAPRGATIRYWTHATGAAAILMVVPSACVFYLRHLGIEEGEPSWLRMAHSVWIVHGYLVVATIFLRFVEEPRRTRYVSTESDIVESRSDED